jgi:hypothetical protein
MLAQAGKQVYVNLVVQVHEHIDVWMAILITEHAVTLCTSSRRAGYARKQPTAY